MPTGYVKKLAKKHKMSIGIAEGRWKSAKAAAKKEGHDEDYDYVTSIFKKMMGESGVAPTFVQYLLIENDLDSIDFDVDAEDDYEPDSRPGVRPAHSEFTGKHKMDSRFDDEFDDEVDDELGDEFADEIDDVEVDLDTDERYLSLPRAERFKLKKMSHEVSGYELEDALQQAFEKSTEGSSLFTQDSRDDASPVAPPVPRSGPRTRAKSGASHAAKIRKLGAL